MEIHIQKCQKCGSDRLKNILYRESGNPDRVYVQCHECQEFVASYVIAPQGYYHHGKGYDSFLRGLQRSGEFMSGRKFQQMFLEREKDEVDAFDEVLQQLRIKEEKKADGKG